jgi:hypothetical protein
VRLYGWGRDVWRIIHFPFVLSLSKHRPFLDRPAADEGRHFDKLSANGKGFGGVLPS